MSSSSVSYDLSQYLRCELYVRGTESMSRTHHKLNSVTKPSLSLCFEQTQGCHAGPELLSHPMGKTRESAAEAAQPVEAGPWLSRAI